MTKHHLLRDERGATIVETAFALPALIILIWGMLQLGMVYRANSGIQHSLGEGARLATLYPTPADADIKAEMESAVYGIGPGEFATVVTDVPASGYKDLAVTYTQPTNLLLFPGPTITVNKSKRVWVASTGSTGAGGTGGTGGTGGSGGTGGTSPTDPGTTSPPPSDPPTTEPGTSEPPAPVTPPTTSPTPDNIVCMKKNGKPC